MNRVRTVAILATCLLAGTASAQNTTQPLNLQLPPGAIPAAASTAASHPASHPTRDAHGNPISPPGVYYGDTSGRAENADRRVAAQPCDDATYNKPQTHGSVSMGVLAGDHVSGSYQSGSFSVTRNLGTCEHPTGGIGFSIDVGQGRFHGRGR